MTPLAPNRDLYRAIEQAIQQALQKHCSACCLDDAQDLDRVVATAARAAMDTLTRKT